MLYGAGLPNDDKNYPLKLFLYQSPADCAHVERDGLNLLAVVKFATGVSRSAAGRGVQST